MRKKHKPSKVELSAIENYQKLLAQWNSVSFSRTKGPAPEKQFPVPRVPESRTSTRVESLVTTGGSTKAISTQSYSGNKMLGIGTMHKSNSVPVFSTEEAKDISKMRRN